MREPRDVIERVIAGWSIGDFSNIRASIARDFLGCSDVVLDRAEMVALRSKFDSSTDMDVFDSMRALLRDEVDLDDRAAVERVLINPYDLNPYFSSRFVNWCIKAAKANKAAGG